MRSITILLLLSYNVLFPQDLNDIKKLDTVYVVFKQGKDQHKTMIKGYDNGYYFIENIFFKTDYIDTSFVKGRKTVIIYKNKSFLKKKQQQIIDIEFIKKYTRFELLNAFGEKPRIYFIIDVDEIKHNKIKLTEVNGPRIIFE